MSAMDCFGSSAQTAQPAEEESSRACSPQRDHNRHVRFAEQHMEWSIGEEDSIKRRNMKTETPQNCTDIAFLDNNKHTREVNNVLSKNNTRGSDNVLCQSVVQQLRPKSFVARVASALARPFSLAKS
jgi:hypothetical protein